MTEYNEETELHRYFWFDYNQIVHKEFWAYLKIRTFRSSDDYDHEMKQQYQNKMLNGLDLDLYNMFCNNYNDLALGVVKDQYYRDMLKGDYCKIYFSRCVKCNKVLVSIGSKQCLWCGFDWH